ncbi:hypothetical protein HUO13_26170 [Saccharopolyspora erythraea]|uniref:hypothetical protein n=1 Tax=Saccharopolyspora erythraea TaxID=1836 RepID=UPI001BA9CEF9|nr:hypothetical protein [Saccharopolyspora erythraea]QUH03837.1 hypothetical protein HUO13_26170 [Saccharopolyspora erythraea]
MRVKIEAGREIDIATPDEIGGIVADAISLRHQMLMRAPEYATVRASTVTLPGYSGRTLTTGTAPIGPRPGRIWDIRRISVHGGWVSLHTDDASPSAYVGQVGGQPGGIAQFGRASLLLRNGQTLYIGNPSPNAVTVTVSLAVADVASGDEWRL